ncbi:MAG: type II secretion system F family protein [Candidatus Omnitrophica bacterium]|nr:type II secretion system F family protein [Candidatus Omnitrophota bacterium]
MDLIISLIVFITVFVFSKIFIERIAPDLIRRYNESQQKRVSKVTNKLEDSFIFLEKNKVTFLTISPLLFAGIFFLLFRNVFGILVGFVFGFSAPGIVTAIIKHRRIKAFEGQLVDSLMILSSSLKGGLSLIQAIEALCEEMPPPISQEFNLILKENKWGVSLEESLRKLRTRMPLETVNLLVSSVLVARETGGELTKVFSRLTDTIRDNIKLKEKISTLTLQGRLQGIVMSILPIAFAFFITKQNPDHFNILWENELGRKLLFAAVAMQIIGMLLIKKISTLKV